MVLEAALLFDVSRVDHVLQVFGTEFASPSVVGKILVEKSIFLRKVSFEIVSNEEERDDDAEDADDCGDDEGPLGAQMVSNGRECLGACSRYRSAMFQKLDCRTTYRRRRPSCRSLR